MCPTKTTSSPIYRNNYSDYSEIRNLSSVDEEFETFCNDSDLYTESSEFIASYATETHYLYSFGLPDGNVELSFSKFYPIQTIINGLYSLKNGFGCRSWRIIVLEKKQVFEIDKIKLITCCADATAGFHAKFHVLSKISNAANVRRLPPCDLIDPNNYLFTQLHNLYPLIQLK